MVPSATGNLDMHVIALTMFVFLAVAIVGKQETVREACTPNARPRPPLRPGVPQ